MKTETKKRTPVIPIKKASLKNEDGRSLRKLKNDQAIIAKLGTMSGLPIARIIALTSKRLNDYILKKEEAITEVTNEYATLKEDGSYLGVEYKDGDETKRRDLTDGYMYGWVDVQPEERKEEYLKKVADILDEPTDFKYEKIKSNKQVTKLAPKEFEEEGKNKVYNVEVTVPLIDVIETKLPGQIIEWLFDTIIEYVE